MTTSSNARQRRVSTDDVWRGEAVQPAHRAVGASEVHDDLQSRRTRLEDVIPRPVPATLRQA